MWKWIKKNWKVVIKVIGFIAVAIAGTIATLKIRKVIIGKVEKPIAFIADVNDDTIIHVKNGTRYIPVKLPINKKGKQIKAKDVKSAGIVEGKIIIAEGKHEVTDRRNVKPIDDNALDSLNLSK